MPDGLEELGELQRTLLDLVWDRGELTVAEARELLAAEGRELAYTTVLSVSQKLEKRGWLAHRRDGRTHVYRAVRSRADAGRGTIRGLVERVFGGSTTAVMQHLVDDERLTTADLAAMRARIDDRLQELGGETDGPGRSDHDAP